MTAAMVGALRVRGVNELQAALAGQIGVLALSIAYGRWLSSSDDFAVLARQSLDELRVAAEELGPRYVEG